MSNDIRTDGEPTPSEMGKELEDPNDQRKSESETMSEQSKPTPTDESNDRMTAKKPAEAINGFDGLYPRMTATDWATVLSLRNDSVSAYRVNIQKLECYGVSGKKCPDNAYNKNGDPVEDYRASECCDHVAAAIYQAPAKPDLGLTTIDGMIEMLDQTRSAAEEAHNTAMVLQRANANNAAAKVRNSSQPPSDEELANREPEGQQSQGSAVNASDAAEDLQEAFDGIVDGMDTQAHGGNVWINKTPDAPDWTFDAWLKNADAVTYDPDKDSPGEYWNNYVEPSDVAEYIDSVIES